MSAETYDLPPLEATGVPRARQMLERARWASRAFASYDRASVMRIVEAVTRVAEDRAEHYAEWAVRETGFGVVADKVVKNRLCSRGILDAYRDHDYVTHRVDEKQKIVEVPRPAGVVLALTPSTNPVSTLYFKVILSLMTRNAVVVSPHPFAKESCADAARVLAEAAVAAGAPDGVVQVVEEPSIPLIDALMTDERTDVILATGGVGVVRAAYSSGNPAIGVGPGNVPVLVDATADLPRAAAKLVASKAFDNSVLCTNESVLIVEESVADRFLREMSRNGAHVLDDAERDRVRDTLFPEGRFDTGLVGKDAAAIAAKAGVRVAPRTRILVAPFDLAVDEEPLAHEKLCPVLGVTRVPSAHRGIRTAAAVLRIGGAGHSAVIHSKDPRTVMDYAVAVNVLRVAVNEGGSTGSAGFNTGLAPSMTIGTGFAGRSSLGENLQPKHLVNLARIAYSSDVAERFPDFGAMAPWSAPETAVPAYPVASNLDPGSGSARPSLTTVPEDGTSELREELRRLIIEELNTLIRG
ncbi:MAG: Alcohol dehydrogenase; Acetaldehyde dehydrogenase [uncultured Nocardioidaceae bacterium]|uniref:Alcohol dehydrogenase Acetaldehyde dehydrogenase n=1 Tax=uncultured Nocardioidaceae bacterium TaxID=253824 RepID=A0A6J4MRJ9_9ACTN|nr:MAG: Alcohol dehydrogenase; Acetaldehyde dehydrogenase [uncultured Nocardioidaceae bacterium]